MDNSIGHHLKQRRSVRQAKSDAPSTYNASSHLIPNLSMSMVSTLRFLKALTTSILKIRGSIMCLASLTTSSIEGNLRVKFPVVKFVFVHHVIDRLAPWVRQIQDNPSFVSVLGPCEKRGAVYVWALYIFCRTY